jgi:hypothetical protein
MAGIPSQNGVEHLGRFAPGNGSRPGTTMSEGFIPNGLDYLSISVTTFIIMNLYIPKKNITAFLVILLLF